MSATTAPQFTATTNRGNDVSLTVANTKSDGTGTIGTDIFDLLDAGPNGTFVDRIEFMPVATVANSTTTATVARIYRSTQGTGATGPTNTRCIGEVQLPAVTTADSSSVANVPIVFPMGYRIGSNEHILVSTHAAAAANTSWKPNPIAADY